MVEFDPEAFGRGLKGLAEGEDSPYICIARAKGLIEAAELHPLAFGLICLPIVKGTYDDSREFLAKNLRTGTENMHAVLAGLNRVAANYRNAEQANLLLPEKVDLPEIKVTATNAKIIFEAAVVYWCKMGLLAMLAQKVSVECARLAVSAGVAAALWLGFMPDDVALSRAHGQWQEAANQLEKFNDDILVKMNALNAAWSGSEAQEAFTRWMDNFREEVEECRDAVAKGADSLKDLYDTLNSECYMAFVATVANLIVLAAMACLSLSCPPLWKAAMEAVGAVLSINTGTRIAYAAAAIKTVLLAIRGIVGTTFVTKKEKGDAGNGVDFEEVALSNEQIEALVRGVNS
ncbi:WXG100 family type VII secretion target [Thermasporomyces composti]|jgi:uncharacterized protein YukE|uniref:Uncharacterized protein n=1 Tax=Thermasporomyces composti TaxID=696763 RepID=A0A3D9V7K2_THECX|nr:hypothetical protein [Thermasporomyces composti]REF37487.1 hypothetical protein DFJ64_2931 [Thermasporomyces composti]